MKKQVKVVRENEVNPVSFGRGHELRRLITKKREGSDKIMLGISRMEPGFEYIWTSGGLGEPEDEIYYMVQGRIELFCEDKKVEAKEGEAVYLPAGHRYRSVVSSDGPAVIVYALTPPIE
jgi:ethanolamine utilization protein EutQ (cupin superfamily)